MNPLQVAVIQSVPRSGSSWLGQIFRSSPHVAFRYQPLFSYAFKDRLGLGSTREDCLQFFQELRHTKDPFVLQRSADYYKDYPNMPDREDADHLVFKQVRYHHILRHLLGLVPEMKVIGLVRHPCATMDSWINAYREFSPDWSMEDQWRSGALKNQGRPEEAYGFDKWKEVANLFLQIQKETPSRINIIRYADLNSAPVESAKTLFSFCGIPFSCEVEDYIASSRSKNTPDAYSVYRKPRPDDQWKTRLPRTIADAIHKELEGTELEQFL